MSDKKSERRAKRAQRIDDSLARTAAKNAERLAKLAVASSGARGLKDARWMAGVAGLTAVGTVAGVSARRSARHGTVEDPHATEDFTLLDVDRGSVVTTDDGVPLAVREVGPVDAPLTVVFVHGFCMCMGAYHFQRARLEEEWGQQVRMVFYDQRGHGQSGRAAIETYTVEQLGRDLETVLAVTVPRGPVVLVGHSMGGMTVLSHARQFPQHYGSPGRRRGADFVCGRRSVAVPAGRDPEKPRAGGRSVRRPLRAETHSCGRAVGAVADQARSCAPRPTATRRSAQRWWRSRRR